MTIVNRRNAILGWSVWQVGKMTAKRKAKQALEVDDGKRPGKTAAAAGLAAAAGGALLIWRRRSGSDSDSS
jgi:hypothetical protein